MADLNVRTQGSIAFRLGTGHTCALLLYEASLKFLGLRSPEVLYS